MRLLACLCAAAQQPEDSRYGEDVVGVLRAQSKLQALDFWMRNPDYLANELINEWEQQHDRDVLNLARDILDSREPDLRRLPMIRYHFGAFEPIDNPLSILSHTGLVRIRREGKPGQVREHVYLLTKAGYGTMQNLAEASVDLAWYRDRAAIVARVAGVLGGAALKDRQYLQAEYAETPLGRQIQPITERVRARLNRIEDGAAA